VKATDRTIKKRFNDKWKFSKRIKFDDRKFLRARIIYLFYIFGVNDDIILLSGNKDFFSLIDLPAHHISIGLGSLRGGILLKSVSRQVALIYLRFRRYYAYNAGRALLILLRNAGGFQINVI
jgi:hypothetical protein